MTKERPILFSGAMVRAILDGRKTQTRRIMKHQPVIDGTWHSLPNYSASSARAFCEGAPYFGNCPYGKPGDRLWVRETWYCDDYRVQRGPYRQPEDLNVDEAREHGTLVYAADGVHPYEAEQPVWKPSIHMPRWASRILLEITGVRVERLNDCSVRDAIAEGADPVLPDALITQACPEDYLAGYRRLWDDINGAGAWEANPWVWVVEFRRLLTTSTP